MGSRRLYRLIRTLHLWAAMALAAGVVMYAITGFFMIHPGLLPDAGQNTLQQVRLPALDEASPPEGLGHPATRAVASILTRELGLRGRLEEVQRVQDGWRFAFRRPGTEEIVLWAPGNPEVEFRTQGGGLQTMFNRLHHLHGYQGGLRFWLWAAFLDVVTLSMFLFAGTGVYLWFRTKTDRRLGWILLVGSAVFVMGSIAHLLLSR